MRTIYPNVAIPNQAELKFMLDTMQQIADQTKPSQPTVQTKTNSVADQINFNSVADQVKINSSGDRLKQSFSDRNENPFKRNMIFQ